MEIINIADAKTHLSKLVEKALSGEEIIIGKRNKPLVRLSPLISSGKKKRHGGQWKNQVVIADDFDVLPEEIEDAFKGLMP